MQGLIAVLTFRFGELASITGGRWLVPHANPETLVPAADTDSRSCPDGCVFVAIRGERFDGHDFTAQAAGRGCAAVILERVPSVPPPCPVLLVPSTLEALGALAAEHRRRLAVPVVAVVGANGKTTTKRLIAAAITPGVPDPRSQSSFGWNVHASARSFNNAVGLPITLLQATINHHAIVCEIGTNALGETAPLAAIAQPDVLVITNTGREHLEGLGSTEGSAREALSACPAVRDNGFVLTCADDPLTGQLPGDLLDALRRRRIQHLRFGASATGIGAIACHGTSIAGTRARLAGLDITLALIGRHNATNAAAAALAAHALGVDVRAALQAVAHVRPQAMRMEPAEIDLPQGRASVLCDAYNANPESMAVALRTVIEVAAKGQRVVLVLGDMLELGPHAPSMHEELADHIARIADEIPGPLLAVLVGQAMRSCALRLGRIRPALPVVHMPTPPGGDLDASAIRAALLPGDLVLLKGSRSMRLERLLEPQRDPQPSAVG